MSADEPLADLATPPRPALAPFSFGTSPSRRAHHLTARVEAVGELSETLKAELFRLYERYYDATTYRLFSSDLENKDYVVLLTDHQGETKGFSTLAVLSFEFDGTRRRAIFSGDTIIDHRHWGEHALAFTWIRLAGRLKAQEPAVPLYWFLIV